MKQKLNDKILVAIKRLDINCLDDKTLCWKCIEPTINKIRGKNLVIKSKVYTHLTSGQQSLLMFWILYGHSQYGVFQFYKEVDYLLLNTDIWKDLKDRLRCFWDDDLLDLVNEMESIYHGYFKTNSFTTLADDSTFQQTITLLNKKINKIVPNSIKRVGKYIRNNPDEFVHFID